MNHFLLVVAASIASVFALAMSLPADAASATDWHLPELSDVPLMQALVDATLP